MKVGMLGMGKLGLPVGLAIESKGHEVKGYDVNPAVAGYPDSYQVLCCNCNWKKHVNGGTL